MLQLRSSGKGSGQLNPVEIISSHRVDFWKGIRVWDWPAWLEINCPEHRIMITIKILVFSAIDLEGKFENQDFNQYFFHAKS